MRFPKALILLLLPLALAAPAALGEGPEPARDLGPELSTVHVRDDDDDMNQTLRSAEAKEVEGKFDEAARLYQDAADTATDQVYRVARRTYLGIREYVNSRIARWPEEGRSTYRTSTDGRAKELYENSIDRGGTAGLITIARRYPNSSYGPRALLALGTRALARGDLDTALRNLLEILHLVPEGEIEGVDRADVIARAGLAAAKRGDRSLLEEMRVRARFLPKETAVTLAGGRVPLTEYLAGLTPAAAGAEAPDGWTTIGGSSSRTGGRTGPDGPLALYWSIEIEGHGEVYETEEAPHSPLIPVHPIIADGQVIVIGHAEVFALPLPTADFVPTERSIALLHPEPIWRFPPGRGGSRLNSRTGQTPAFATAGEGVLALPFRDLGSPFPSPELEEDLEKSTIVTLSISEEGKRLDQRGGVDPVAGEMFKGVIFSGAPVVSDGRVYVTGTRLTHRVETLVFGFEAKSGRGMLDPMWGTSVCLGGTVLTPRWGFGSLDRQSIDASSVSLRNGVLYVCSNTGAVAALDGTTGEILWIHAYERTESPPSLYTRQVPIRRTWFPNPPMLDHRFVYVTPLDSDKLFIYFQRPDLATGYVEHDRFGRDDIVDGFEPEYLIGVRDGVAFVAGRTLNPVERPLFAVKAGPDYPASENGRGDQARVRWRAAIEEIEPHGRGVLAGSALYFPTKKGVYRVAVADGAVTRLIDPLSAEVREEMEERKVIGNLAVSGPWLVLASHDSVSLFGPAPPEKEKPEKGD